MKRDYPERPIVGVGAIILRSDPEPQVVLVKRAKEPLKGEWTIPGGALELGESLESGACREALEETGLVVRPTGDLEAFDRIYPDAQKKIQYHYVLIDYICTVAGGELRAGGDVADARWFNDRELDGDGLSRFTAGVARKAMKKFAQAKAI